MKPLTISVYGRDYQIACDEGQEGHLRRLAAQVDERMHQLAYRMGPAGESMLFILTCLMLADELTDATREAAQLREQIQSMPQTVEGDNTQQLEAVVASTIDQIAEHLERIAEQVEKGYTVT